MNVLLTNHRNNWFERRIRKIKILEQKSKLLKRLTNRIAHKYFHMNVPIPVVWNGKFKTTGGYFSGFAYYDPKGDKEYSEHFIAINPEMLTRNNMEMLIDTIKHELTHYYLWRNHKPCGHNKEFHRIAHRMHFGIHVPPPEEYLKPYHHFKYDYECPHCHHKDYIMHYIPSKDIFCPKCKIPMKLIYVMDKKQYKKERQTYKQAIKDGNYIHYTAK